VQQIDHTYKKRRFLQQNTIKHNCPARVYMREITRYPHFAVRCFAILLWREGSHVLMPFAGPS